MKKATRFLKRVCACVLSVALGFGMAPTDMMAQASETTETGKEVVLRFAVASDMHLFNSIDGKKNEEVFKGMFESAYEYAEKQTYNKLDAVVLVGDIVDRGTTEEYTELKRVFNEITVKEETKVLTVMGNHEWWASNNDGYSVLGDKAYADGVTAIDKITTKTEDWSVEINGYQFIAMSPLKSDTYGADKLNWMSQQVQAAAAKDATVQTAGEATSKKPIFTFQHHPIVNTVYSSETVTSMVEDSKTLDSIYGACSQVINFSGHLHVPVNTPTSICQKNGYTQVSTGSMYSIDSLEKASAYGSLPPNSTNTGQYTIVEVYKDNTVKLLPYDQYRNGFYNTPQVGSTTQLVYTVDVNDTENWLYTDAKKETEAPVFTGGTTVSFDNITYKSAEVSFAQATDNVGVYAYDITCTPKDSGTASTWRVFSEWYFGKDMPATIKYNMTGLKAETIYDVSVTPVDFYGNQGTAITGTVTTGKMDANDYLKLTFDTISDGAWYFNVNNRELFADQYYKTPVVIDGKEGHVIMSVQNNGSVCIWSNFFNLCNDASTPVETFKIPADAVMQAVKSSDWITPIENGDTVTVGETLYLKKRGDAWVVSKEVEGGNGTFDDISGMNPDDWYIGDTPIGALAKKTETLPAKIKNSDFEAETLNVANWIAANGTSIEVVKDGENKVLKVTYPESFTGNRPNVHYTDTIPYYQAGVTYTATVKIKADAGVSWRVYVEAMGNVQTSPGTQYDILNGTGDGTWATYTFTFTPGQVTSYSQLGFQYWGGKGNIYLDDFYVTYENPKTEKTPHEVAINGNFEAETFNGDNWGTMNNTTVEVVTEPGNETNHVLKFERPAAPSGNPTAYYVPHAAVYEVGKTYTVTTRIKAATGVKWNMYVDGMTENTAVSSGNKWSVGAGTGNGAWDTCTFTFTTTKESTEAQIGFQLIEGEGTVYLDDFSVAWIEEIPEYDDTTDGLVELDGNWALRMGNGEAPVIYDIPDIPAGKYEYSFSVKNESKTEAAKFTFCGETIEVAPGSEWVQKKGVLSSTEAITKLTFQRISGTFYLDNVKLDEYEEEEEHTCNFNQEVVDAKYLKTPATCTSPAVYYKSCTCGEKGTETFEYGTAKGHTYQNKVDAKYLKTPATCTSPAVYYTSCKECGEKGTTTFTSGTAKAHTYQNKVDAKYLKTPATCTSPAVYYTSCKECGEKGTTTFTSGTAKAHTYKTVVKAATTKKDGQTVEKCSSCGMEKNQKTIYKASKVSLKTTALSYNGKAQKPKVIVKDSKGKTISSKYYTLTWEKGLKNVGTYKVTVKFKGNYSGSKALSFKINPKKISIKKPTAAKKAFTVKWSKQSKSLVDGYQVWYSTNKNLKKAVTKKDVKNKNGKVTSYKASKLKGNKTYYVKVRSYKKVGKTTYYSDWSAVQKVKTKK